ncbi:hypothetical protein ACVWU4_000898 [Campylobacter coli]
MEKIDNEMDYYSEKVKNEKLERIRKAVSNDELDYIIASVSELGDKASIVNNQISESVFKEYFAEMFINKDFLNPNNHKAIFLKWLELTNSPYDEIDVVDDVTRELLFTVPPIFSRIITKSDGLDMNINNVLTKAEQKERWFPGAGEALIRDNIVKNKEKRLFNYDKNAIDIYAKRWREIINRYAPKDDIEYDAIEDLVTKDTRSEISIELSSGLDYD